jgi:membrane-associated protease RseP (regulator of RpoE activity)
VDVLVALLFVVALIISIVLHEAGHMMCAKWSGGKVTEFFVGFGAKIWSFQRGETEYGLKAIPAGGYVRIVGMTDLDEIEPGDEDRALKNKPARNRLLTLSAGSIMHFIIALVVFAFVPMAFGVTVASTGAQIGALSCAPTTVSGACTATSPAPAKHAGLQTGDTITSVDGVAVHSWTDLVNDLRKLTSGKPVAVTYTRAGVSHSTTLTPVDGHTSDPSGNPIVVPMVGIQDASVQQHYNPVKAVTYSGSEFWTSVKSTFQGLGSIPASVPKLWDSTVKGAPRSDDTPVSVVGMAQVSGQAVTDYGWASFFLLLGAINVFIGVFNLLPLLPLDGGHIAILLYEQARKGIFRLLRRPEPGRVDINKLLPFAYGFLLLFVALSLLLVAADITNPIQLPT